MATIIHGALWTLTNKAAEKMVEDEILYRCNDSIEHVGLNPSDYPVYHVTYKAAVRGCGVATMGGWIKRAEQEVES